MKEKVLVISVSLSIDEKANMKQANVAIFVAPYMSFVVQKLYNSINSHEYVKINN